MATLDTSELAASPRAEAHSTEGTLHAELLGVLDAPVAALWPALSEPEAQHAWVPYMRLAVPIERRDDAILCQGHTNLPWPLQDRHWQIRMRNRIYEDGDGPVYVAEWTYVEGSGNLQDTRGAWSLRPLPDGNTLVHLDAVAVMGSRDVPPALLRWAERKALPSMLEALWEQRAR